MIDGRGLHMIERGKQTKARIKEYITTHPEALKQDVCKALSINAMTLRKHLKDLDEG